MTKRILINVDVEETRAAIVADGQLLNLEIQGAFDSRVRGNVYTAVVRRVEPSLQAAFVDYGARKEGFLPLGELQPRYFPDQNRRLPIEKALKAGKQLLVQVAKDAVGTKGASLTTYISIPGRFLVLMPDSDKGGVSRKLPDEERSRVKQLLEEVELPEGLAVIARTASLSRGKLEIQKDLTYLTRLWEGIQQKAAEVIGPALIYQEQNLAIRFLRDYQTSDVDEIWVDDPATFQDVRDFVTVLMPRHAAKVRLHADATPLFKHFGIENQIQDVFARKVQLPSGGSIVVDQTEALVAIDVNSGRVRQKDIEDTALLTNLEAAKEIARQCVLRDLGGLLVIDFIDMREKAHQRKVEAALKAAFKEDKARLNFGHISEFGLLELSRQRIRSDLLSGSFRTCEHCEGTGLVRTDESAAQRILRQIKENLVAGSASLVRAEVSPALAHYLLNQRRRELTALERAHNTRIEIAANPAVCSNSVRVQGGRLGPPVPEQPAGPTTPTLDFKAPAIATPGERPSVEPLSLYDRTWRRENVPDGAGGETDDAAAGAAHPAGAPAAPAPPPLTLPVAPPRVELPAETEAVPPPVADFEPEPPAPPRFDPAQFARMIPAAEQHESARGSGLGGWLKRLFGAAPPPRVEPSRPLGRSATARSVVDPVGIMGWPTRDDDTSAPTAGPAAATPEAAEHSDDSALAPETAGAPPASTAGANGDEARPGADAGRTAKRRRRRRPARGRGTPAGTQAELNSAPPGPREAPGDNAPRPRRRGPATTERQPRAGAAATSGGEAPARAPVAPGPAGDPPAEGEPAARRPPRRRSRGGRRRTGAGADGARPPEPTPAAD